MASLVLTYLKFDVADGLKVPEITIKKIISIVNMVRVKSNLLVRDLTGPSIEQLNGHRQAAAPA